MGAWCTLRFEFSAMASPCSLQIDAQDEPAMRHAATQVIAEVTRIEKKFSRYTADSVISRINEAAGHNAVDIDAETSSLLDFADALWRQSEGLFDITSGVLRQAWDFKTDTTPQLPQPAQIQGLLGKVGWKHVERDNAQVHLPIPGMELDFGGFGKEYAADRAASVLQGLGLAHALINLGGDLHALGERGLPELRGTPWYIDIQHPRPDPSHPRQMLARLPLARGGLATSGDYERFFIHAGKRYCHILDPHSGWPVSHWQSVSVLAANTTTAGALSTIAMLKGHNAIAWLESQGVRYLAVREDGHAFTR